MVAEGRGRLKVVAPPVNARRLPSTSFVFCFEGYSIVAKVNPGEFFRQVRAETAKVVWPSRKQTMTTTVMVVIMTALLGIFFFGVDSAFSAIVKALLGLLA